MVLVTVVRWVMTGRLVSILSGMRLIKLPAGRQAVVTGRLLVYSVAEQGQQVGRRASAPGQMEAGLRHLQGEGEQPQNEGAVGRAYATL